MPYPINQRAHQFNSIQSVPVSFGLWDTALKFLSPGPRSEVTDHLGSSDLFLMFGCMTSNFMWLVPLSSLVKAKMSSLNEGFQISQLVSCLSSYSNLFFAFSGNSFFCWISDPTAKAVAVVTPVCLALVFNAVCLTKSLYAIHCLKKV